MALKTQFETSCVYVICANIYGKAGKTQSPLFRPISCLFLAPLPVSLATTPFFLPLSPPILSSSASIYARNQFYKWPAGKGRW